MFIPQTTQLSLSGDLIDFAIGQPDPALLPHRMMAQAAAHRLSQDDNSYLYYGAEAGNGHLRLALSQYLSDGYDVPVAPESLFMTAGGSQALDLICTLYTQAGDTIFVEEPSYFLALKIFADHRLNVVGIPTNEDGIIIEALREELARTTPVFVYTIPAFHNPSAVTLSAARREALVRLSEEHNFLIVADEVYQLLSYTRTPPPPFPHFDTQQTVLSIGSFSKIMAPGLRLGWIQAGPNHLQRLSVCGLVDSGGGLNPFTSAVVHSLFELGLIQKNVKHLKQTYARRAAVLTQALQTHLPPEATFIEPSGGFFIWLTLPPEIDTTTLLPAAHAQQVSFNPGSRFSSQDGLQHCMRLCFAFYDEARLAEGAKRLGWVLRSV